MHALVNTNKSKLAGVLAVLRWNGQVQVNK